MVTWALSVEEEAWNDKKSFASSRTVSRDTSKKIPLLLE
jgi:hypothetical protein